MCFGKNAMGMYKNAAHASSIRNNHDSSLCEGRAHDKDITSSDRSVCCGEERGGRTRGVASIREHTNLTCMRDGMGSGGLIYQ